MSRIGRINNPPMTLLCKLGSVVVHVDEALSAEGHPFDWEAVKPLIADPEVQQWIADMGVLLPRKRNVR